MEKIDQSFINEEYLSLKQKNQELKMQFDEKYEKINEQNINYQQIIHLLFNSQGIDSYYTFLDNKLDLYKALIQGDLSYVIFEEDNTAGVLKKINSKSKVLIPNSIIYQSQEFIITKILKEAFKKSKTIKIIEFEEGSQLCLIDKKAFASSSLLKIIIPTHVEIIEEGAFLKCELIQSVEFEPNSELKIIGKKAFYWSSLKKISIPSQVTQICDKAFEFCCKLKTFEIPQQTELKSIGKTAFGGCQMTQLSLPSDVSDLKNGWCQSLENVKKFTIYPRDKQNVMFYENRYLLGKTDPNSENFDVILVAIKSIRKAIIPSFIKRIDSYSFSDCEILESVEFENNSVIESIGKNAFIISSINKISFPASLKFIDKGWIGTMPDLINITISPSNPNFIYFDNSFIIGKSDINGKDYDVIHCARKDIINAIIPSFIKIIGPSAFHFCGQLEKIEFNESSKLERICEMAFTLTPLEEIIIPSSVKCIEEDCFCMSDGLKRIVFSDDSKLDTIKANAFCGCNLESLTIPSSIIELENSWCFDTCFLNNIIVIQNEVQNVVYYEDKFLIGKSNLKSDNFDTLLFAGRNTKQAIIPSFIKRIGSDAFGSCTKLKFVDVLEYSELEYIGENAFSSTPIKSFSIPPKVYKIENRAFVKCEELQIVEIADESEMYAIDKKIFKNSGIDIFMVPSKKFVIL